MTLTTLADGCKSGNDCSKHCYKSEGRFTLAVVATSTPTVYIAVQ